jgi:hypothetical protein
MNIDQNTTPINSLMLAVKALKRTKAGPELSPSEKAERLSSLIDRLALYQRPPVSPAMQPIALSAEDR